MIKKVEQRDPNTGELIAIHESQVAASKALGLPKTACSNINLCIHGKSKTAFGFAWTLTSQKGNMDPEAIERMRTKRLNSPAWNLAVSKAMSEAMIKYYKENPNHLCKQVQQINKTTNEVIKTWRSMSDASRELGISIGSISQATKGGTHKSAGGWKWKLVVNKEEIQWTHAMVFPGNEKLAEEIVRGWEKKRKNANEQ